MPEGASKDMLNELLADEQQELEYFKTELEQEKKAKLAELDRQQQLIDLQI